MEKRKLPLEYITNFISRYIIHQYVYTYHK